MTSAIVLVSNNSIKKHESKKLALGSWNSLSSRFKQWSVEEFYSRSVQTLNALCKGLVFFPSR